MLSVLDMMHVSKASSLEIDCSILTFVVSNYATGDLKSASRSDVAGCGLQEEERLLRCRV